jgi:LmbE family N-acetylglucosaminyl deacetylase
MRLPLTLVTASAVLLSSLCFGSFRAAAQTTHVESTKVEDERGIVALDQALRAITNPFTVMCVSARPGDEDDGTLAYLRKKLGARTVMLFATRGESESGSRFGEMDAELGAVHTREALEAARITGSDILFLNLHDPGYSRSADEAISIWNHDDALRRFVRAYRSLRPDVIITRHNAKSGEGVEQAVARLALEAFAAAGDAKVAPEADSEAWRVSRFFHRAGEVNPDVSINLNDYDNVRGRTYARIGLAAHQRFASRGANLDRLTPDREKSFFKLVASASDEKLKRDSGLLDGITLPEKITASIAPPRLGASTLVESLASGERLVDALIEKLIEKRAEGTPAALHERYGAQFVRVIRFTSAIEQAIAIALGLNLDVTVSDSVVVPGQRLAARVSLRNGGVRAFPIVFSGPERLSPSDKNPALKDSEVLGLGSGGLVSQEFEYEVAKDSAVTVPASVHLYDEDYYAVGSSLPGTQPAEPFGNRLVFSAEVGMGQISIRLAALARFDVAPPIEISTIPFATLRDWSKPRDFEFPVRVRNRTPGPVVGALWVVPLALTQDDYEPVHIAFGREDQEVIIRLELRLPILKPPLAPDVLLEFRPEKPAPPDPLGTAKIAARLVDFEVADEMKVGYIAGKDDWLALALTEIGVSHQALKIEDISSIEHGNTANLATQSRPDCRDLSGFDAIVIDEDAYLSHADLILQNRCLFRYARQGGTLIVLSQRPDDWNLTLSGVQFAPYPIKLSRFRLTVETARVKILDAENLILTKPNQITSKDFEGWIIERAVNVPGEWARDYTPLLESSDAGEEPTRGALLVARYGEGTYINTSLSFRRQLLAGNAGAYRLLANLLSFSKTAKPPKPQ